MEIVEFMRTIYANVKPGMKVVKPRKVSQILRITSRGNIYYLIGEANEKAVSKSELEAVHGELEEGGLTTKRMYEIVGSAKPCNVTTIKWILRACDLAREGSDGVWRRT